MIEAGALIDLEGKVIHWHTPAARSSISLPDSRDLWDIIWTQRDSVLGFAHTHPGAGRPGPSMTDITTFAAVEAALGRRLAWWILSKDSAIELEWFGPHRHAYREVEMRPEPAWAKDLRERSGYFLSDS
jgi:proteasome lid subunit RPN8/RPN11